MKFVISLIKMMKIIWNIPKNPSKSIKKFLNFNWNPNLVKLNSNKFRMTTTQEETSLTKLGYPEKLFKFRIIKQRNSKGIIWNRNYSE